MRYRPSTLLSAYVLSAAVALAQPRLHDLDIRVTLHHDGSATIVETRRMTIDSEGTECYIGLGNMGGSTVRGLWVTDEKGRRYENVGEWDSDLKRNKKTGKCGIVKTRHGYELCWGLGSEGERTYTTGYVMTGLVRAYPDADAIRHVFLDKAVWPKPEHARITISRMDSLPISRERLRVGDSTSGINGCGIWAFCYTGSIDFRDGAIVAETNGSMGDDDAIYLMCSFPKGMFQPTLSEEDTFEHKKQLALEGSDYGEPERTLWEKICDALFAFVFYGIFLAAAGFFGYIFYNIARQWLDRRKFRKTVTKDLGWYRDIPLGGDLRTAALMMKDATGSDCDLLSAAIMQLVSHGACSIRQVQETDGGTVNRLVVNDFPARASHPILLRRVHELFSLAAGSDRMLDAGELETFMTAKENNRLVAGLANHLVIERKDGRFNSRIDEVRQVVGLKKFLREFTLAGERHATEVALWKDYLVWATLFGIADQVISDMHKINPDFFRLDQLAAQMTQTAALSAIGRAAEHGTKHFDPPKSELKDRYARHRGGGGSSSRGGGGGGFSGGGGGGGIR